MNNTIKNKYLFLFLFFSFFFISIEAKEGALPKDVMSVFENPLCTQLKKGVSQKSIDKISDIEFKQLAQRLFNDEYSVEFRLQDYEAYPNVETTAKELKVGRYNQFENPTGIYFESGKEVLILVDKLSNENISLRIYDFETRDDASFPLNEGLNKILVKNNGLGYISYYSDNYSNLSPLKVHIVGGLVNGYFDKNIHRKDQWKDLLKGSVCDFFDIKGKYINLAYKVDDLIEHCNDGLALIDVYDEIVYQQYKMMGLVKYDRIPKNHMFSRNVKSGLFADGIGVGIDSGAMKSAANPKSARREAAWLIAHELGHVNQIRPGLKWHGTTEVTNNIYSIYIQYLLAPDLLGLERFLHNDGDNNRVIGGRFNAYLNYGVLKGEPWYCQRGPDKMENYQNGGDHFVKLVPLWQLMLYYHFAKGTSWYTPDWYADIAEQERNKVDEKKSSGQLQIDFMKSVCDIVGEDLSEFFERAGMLKPIDIEMSDYGIAQHTITQNDCDLFKEYAKRYPQPKSTVMNYISANSIDAFRYSLPVKGEYMKGVNMFKDQGYCIIDHNVWQNTTVFETYEGDALVKIAMTGTDSNTQSSTLVRYPEGATRIEAVSWDGERTLVYGER